MWTCALVSSATRPARPRFFSGTLQDLSHATLQDFAQRLERRKLHPLCVPVVQRVDGRPTEPAPLTRYEASCSENRPGRYRTCNPRFWSPLLTTPALLDNAGVDTNPGTVLRGGGHNTSSLSKFVGPPRHSCNRGVVRRLRQRR